MRKNGHYDKGNDKDNFEISANTKHNKVINDSQV